MKYVGRLFFAAVLGAMCGTAALGADVRIVKPGADKVSVEFSGFRCSGDAGSLLFLATLRGDLKRSGWFAIAGDNAGSLSVRGACTGARGRLSVRCEVSVGVNGRTVLSRQYAEDDREARKLAHQVADDIVLAVKRVPGIAGTRIVMVGARSGKRDLYTCGADGMDVVRVTGDGAACLAPAWAPDGRWIAYTSLHKGYPDVYTIDFRTTRRTKLASYPGINAGADISPCGRQMALALSKDGNPDLYIMDLGSRRLTRVTRTQHAAEASPSWSPDGSRIVFVSDRSGSPQLYVTGRAGGQQTRISFRGRENVSPDWGPDGRIACSSSRGGRYELCVMTPGSGQEEQLTRGSADYEDPSWAADGRHIVCSRTERYRSDLYILDTLGDPPLRLTTLPGDWYSPAWSPK